MFVVFALITTQALLGACDNLWHHEITQRLPAKRGAAGELLLHSARELIYAFVFFGLAWFRWQGVWAGLIAFIRRLAHPARVLVNASAIGYYGVRQNEWLDENSSPRSGVL